MTITDLGELKITVRPGTQGWVLERPFTDPVDFQSGAEAERTARRDAEGLARAGLRVILDVVLKDGSLAARLTFEAAEPEPA
jgi:hypothetical protein